MLDECDEYGRLPGVDSASNGRTAVASPPWPQSPESSPGRSLFIKRRLQRSNIGPATSSLRGLIPATFTTLALFSDGTHLRPNPPTTIVRMLSAAMTPISMFVQACTYRHIP